MIMEIRDATRTISKSCFFVFNIQFERTDISPDAIVGGPVKPVLKTIVFTYENRNIGRVVPGK